MTQLTRAVAAMLLMAVASAGSLRAQDHTSPRQLTATRINPQPPRLDGRLDDPTWAGVEWAAGFFQKEPTEGEPAKNRSQVAIVYDDDAIYVAARLHSADPNNILATVSRRDNTSNSERIIVSLDTYRDRRTAYSFAVTAVGTRADYYHGRDSEGNRDYDWDPVWEAKTARTADGWTAEIRIPFTQLRFANRDTQVWGVNFNRWVPNGNEDSYWVVVPKDETGWSSRMGELVGIEGVQPSRRIEVMPYMASDATVSDTADAANPFDSDGRSATARMGADVRMGVGPNFTLEGTINPDFGQVEADPAVVNLSAFETFFSERRPFFTEGSQLLSGGGAGYFYSRRIGARPHGNLDGDYVDAPRNTSILGAAKLTGRTQSGLSLGVLGAVTAKEEATAFDATANTNTEEVVEPLTGYGVVRAQQEFGENASTAGVILSAVERNLDDNSSLGNDLRTRAITGGTDWNLRFRGGEYILSGNAGFSRIEGSPESIESAQRSSARYFQRPDVDYVTLDPTRRSLNGWVARTEFEKNEGDWLWSVRAGAESPEFELNDAGRLSTADDIDASGGIRYRQNSPGGIYQSWWTGFWTGSGWNFGNSRQYSFFDLEGSMTFKNYYGVWASAEYFPGAQSDNLTRGGPSMGTANSWNFDLNVWSHHQGRFSWRGFASYDGDELGGWDYFGQGGVTYRPGSRWEVSLRPSYRREVNPRQYVDTIEGNGGAATFGNRYVFAFTERSNFSSQFRLNYSFTPDFSLEMYAEPFAASGRFYDHGELRAARSKDLRTYGEEGTAITQEGDGSYTVTDGADTFALDARDFNFVSFRSNLVLRWEWNPGSTLFVVWQQNRSESEENGRLVGVSRLLDSFSAEGDNFFAIKLTYWLPFS